jgi:predicted GIY-YIG superfamily endonuclease
MQREAMRCWTPMPARRYYLYILANSPKGVLYVGSTGDLRAG